MGRNLKNLLKATRIERSLIPVSFIFLACAIANKINFQIFLLITICILIYVSGGLLNARIDKDFKLKKDLFSISALILIALLISVGGKILLLSTIMWVIFSFIYNKLSRKILLADSIILSITHCLIPFIIASIILDNFQGAFQIGIFFFLSINLIIPMKNLKGKEEDKKRNYKNLLTKFENGRAITLFLYFLYFPLIFSTQFIFNLGNIFLIFSTIIFLFYIFSIYLLNRNQDSQTYSMARLIVILANIAFIFSITNNLTILLGISTLSFLYSIQLIKEIKQ